MDGGFKLDDLKDFIEEYLKSMDRGKEISSLCEVIPWG